MQMVAEDFDINDSVKCMMVLAALFDLLQNVEHKLGLMEV